MKQCLCAGTSGACRHMCGVPGLSARGTSNVVDDLLRGSRITILLWGSHGSTVAVGAGSALLGVETLLVRRNCGLQHQHARSGRTRRESIEAAAGSSSADMLVPRSSIPKGSCQFLCYDGRRGERITHDIAASRRTDHIEAQRYSASRSRLQTTQQPSC